MQRHPEKRHSGNTGVTWDGGQVPRTGLRGHVTACKPEPTFRLSAGQRSGFPAPGLGFLLCKVKGPN